MSSYWIDVFSPGGGPTVAGTKLGSGPIRTALDWESQRRLDAVGSFSFTMPASDPKAALLQPRRVVWAYTMVDVDDPASPIYSPQLELGSGTIEKIDTQEGPPLTLRVSGPDLLGELAARTVGELAVLEQDWVSLAPVDGVYYGMVRHIGPIVGDKSLDVAYDGSTAAATDVITISDYGETDAEALYIGYDARFDKANFALGTNVNAQATTLLIQYYSEAAGWQTITPLTNTTIATGVPFAQDGEITWTRPTDWARYSPSDTSDESWFWIRISRTTAVGNNISVDIKEIEVYADVPTKNGVNLIMAHAPTAWGVSGYPDTQSDHYIWLDGESVINALITLTEHGGQIPQ
jgi:hypothetical protein